MQWKIFGVGVLAVVATASSYFLDYRMKPLGPEEPFDIPRMERLAEYGDLEAQLLLGQMYQSGTQAPENKEKALQYYQMAARRGSPEGAYNAALLMGKENGVEALKFLWVAYQGGIQDAGPLLGSYLVRTGSKDEGFSILRSVAQNGHPTAMWNLATLAAEGHLEGGIEEALFWSNLARTHESDMVKKMSMENQIGTWTKQSSISEIRQAEQRSRFWQLGVVSRPKMPNPDATPQQE